MNHNSLPRQLVQLVGSYGSKFPHHVNFVMGQCVVMYIMCKINFLCTSCRKCNGLAFFSCILCTDHVCRSDQSGGIYNSKSPVAMDIWSKNHSLSLGYRPRTRMVLDHKSLAIYRALTIT